jgi:Flp pilus assembly protein TadG
MTKIQAMINRMRRDEGGYMVIEAVLVLPMLLWAFLALYTFWDAYRSVTTIQKAAYSISDLISRQQSPINAAFINGMRNAMDQMILQRQDTELRVTSIVKNKAKAKFEVQWSCVSGTTTLKLTTDDLQQLADRIPDMADGNTVILVETWVDYKPVLDIGVTEKRFEQFILTRPRYQTRIALSDTCT